MHNYHERAEYGLCVCVCLCLIKMHHMSLILFTIKNSISKLTHRVIVFFIFHFWHFVDGIFDLNSFMNQGHLSG